MLPEELARQNIDAQLTATGWLVQNLAQINLWAGWGVAVREFPLQTGEADYLHFVDRKAVGVVGAKPEGTALSGVAEQAGNYTFGLPENIPHTSLPLPFQYENTGLETLFRDNRDPQPRSRGVFAFHRPEALGDWASVWAGLVPDRDGATTRVTPSVRGRLQRMPSLITDGSWHAQIEAIRNLERSLAEDRPRTLIQLATGSGKTFTAVTAICRLIKFARVRRVLLLVDRSNLARQTLKEFQSYTTPDDGRKFSELYNTGCGHGSPGARTGGLKRYMAAVLKVAMEGKLVKGDGGRRELGEGRLPEGWRWVKIQDIAETIGGVTKGRNLSGKRAISLPYLRVANVQRG